MKTNEELYKEWISRFDAKNPPHMRDAFMAGMESFTESEDFKIIICNVKRLIQLANDKKNLNGYDMTIESALNQIRVEATELLYFIENLNNTKI